MKVPLLDLKAQYATIKDDVDAAVKTVFENQAFILGPTVQRFESEFAAAVGVSRAVGCASGTDALLLSLMALGIGQGDEVLTTPYTFFATAGAVWRAGARPVFCDILPDTFNIDPTAIPGRITARTKAIIPVHLFGLLADMAPILATARDRGLAVIEDACQSIGATGPAGIAGAVGTTGCFSFFPSKNLGGAGDGGMITTNDGALADTLASLRVHGSTQQYHHTVVGTNSRLDALQAAVLAVKLPYTERWGAARRANASTYGRLFAAAGLGGTVVTPVIPDGYTHVFNQYAIRVPERDTLRAYLAAHDIGTAVYYPLPLHLQQCFAKLGHRPGDFPESERAALETLALPVYPELTGDMQAYVVDTIRTFYARG